jgi:hypothetical protein
MLQRHDTSSLSDISECSVLHVFTCQSTMASPTSILERSKPWLVSKGGRDPGAHLLFGIKLTIYRFVEHINLIQLSLSSLPPPGQTGSFAI